MPRLSVRQPKDRIKGQGRTSLTLPQRQWHGLTPPQQRHLAHTRPFTALARGPGPGAGVMPAVGRRSAIDPLLLQKALTADP